MRKILVLIHDKKKKAVHFTCTSLQGNDKWYPYDYATSPLFPVVEKMMVEHNIANNIVSIERVRSCGVCEDFKITYNTPKKYK